MPGVVDNKLYVGGLAQETTTESLRAYFEHFGDLTDCIVITDKATQRSRCFGYVAYKQPEIFEAVLGESPHEVDGKEVNVKRAIREPGQNGRDESPSGAGPE